MFVHMNAQLRHQVICIVVDSYISKAQVNSSSQDLNPGLNTFMNGSLASPLLFTLPPTEHGFA